MGAQVATRQSGAGAPWLDEEARGQLASRVRALEQEQDRCVLVARRSVAMVVCAEAGKSLFVQEQDRLVARRSWSKTGWWHVALLCKANVEHKRRCMYDL